MRKKHTDRHFISHIVEHVIGVLFVLGVASASAYLSHGAFAQTLATPFAEGTSPSSVPAVDSSAGGGGTSAVFFAVTPAPVTDCSGAQPMTMVLFALSPLSGGTFALTSNSGTVDMKLSWGEYPLPNGTYIWRGIPNSGFTNTENDTGTFELKGVCVAAEADAPSGVSEKENAAGGWADTPFVGAPPTITPPPVPVILSRPALKIFSDNVPITDMVHVFDTGDIEFRIGETGAKKIAITATSNETGKVIPIGNAAIDDLLSIKGTDIWVYFWNPKNIPEGSYTVNAHVLRIDGTTIDTFPASLVIRHKRTASQSAPREDIPVLSGDDISSPSFTATTIEKEEILERINDPSACTNALECEIFCMSKANNVCTAYAQHAFPTHGPVVSFAEGVSRERIALMLHDPRRRPQELPEAVTNAEEFSVYCSELANEAVCTKALVRNDLATPESLLDKKTALERVSEEQKSILSERIGARAFIDSDADGVTDYDEMNIYHIDPKSQDTDRDGFVDGAEILAHTDPRGDMDVSRISAKEGNADLSADEEVQLENPLISGDINSAVLAISSANALSVGTDDKGNATVKKLRLSGVSLPNSFVTIFIYSDPIMVTVKADASGAWVYTLDQELQDGTHHAWSALVDADGRILAKSAAFPFVKEAAAVSVGAEMLQQKTVSPRFFGDASLYGVLAVVIALLGILFSAFGFVVYHKKEDDHLAMHHRQ